MSAPGSCGRLLRVALVAAVTVMAGCGDKATKRGRIHGTVTVDGEPVAKGQIRLFALTGGGAGTDAVVVDGKYDIPAERGPTAGTYRVEIVSLKPTGRRVRDPDSGAVVDEVVNVLPPRFNTESTLQITYDPGADAPHDFHLKTK